MKKEIVIISIILISFIFYFTKYIAIANLTMIAIVPFGLYYLIKNAVKNGMYEAMVKFEENKDKNN